MLQGFNTDRTDISDYHQRVADRNIQSIEDRNEEIEHAKNGFIGMLAGILVGAVVGWIFLAPTNENNKATEIPIIRKSIKPFKIQPNEPGGMEIDNQDREIYHIVDNIPKENKEVKIKALPDVPQLVVETATTPHQDLETLVESIEEELPLNNDSIEIDDANENVKIAQTELMSINTNSREKIVIPQKIEHIEVKLQDTINAETSEKKSNKEEQKTATAPKKEITPKAPQSLKGTWYTQIIASSSRSAVENLWKNLSQKHSFLKTYYHEVEEITSANGNTLYRLKVGAFKTRKQAEELSNKLKQNKVSSIIKQN